MPESWKLWEKPRFLTENFQQVGKFSVPTLISDGKCPKCLLFPRFSWPCFEVGLGSYFLVELGLAMTCSRCPTSEFFPPQRVWRFGFRFGWIFFKLRQWWLSLPTDAAVGAYICGIIEAVEICWESSTCGRFLMLGKKDEPNQTKSEQNVICLTFCQNCLTSEISLTFFRQIIDIVLVSVPPTNRWDANVGWMNHIRKQLAKAAVWVYKNNLPFCNSKLYRLMSSLLNCKLPWNFSDCHIDMTGGHSAFALLHVGCMVTVPGLCFFFVRVLLLWWKLVISKDFWTMWSGGKSL